MPDLISLLLPNNPNERCGLIVNDEIVEIDNVHQHPDRGFRMDPVQLLAHIENATASWHTHPGMSPVLSEEDYAGFLQWPKLVHHIIGVLNGKPAIQSYQIIDGLVMKL